MHLSRATVWNSAFKRSARWAVIEPPDVRRPMLKYEVTSAKAEVAEIAENEILTAEYADE
jgi:hypothetical protein